MRDYFLQNSEFLRPPKLLPEDPEKIECLEEGINDYLEGGFTPGEIVLFSQHEGEHDMMKELMSEIMEEFSARFATCIGETLNSGLFLPKNDDALLNVNVYSLGTFAETLRFLSFEFWSFDFLWVSLEYWRDQSPVISDHQIVNFQNLNQ